MSDRPTISDQLRTAILTAGETRYAIAKATGVAQSILSRFVTGGRGIEISAIDKLAAHLGLELRAAKRTRRTGR